MTIPIRFTPIIEPNIFPLRHPVIWPAKGPTTLSVTLAAVSIEGDSDKLRVEINWDGQWRHSDEEMAKHLHGHYQIGFHGGETDHEANSDQKHGSFGKWHRALLPSTSPR